MLRAPTTPRAPTAWASSSACQPRRARDRLDRLTEPPLPGARFAPRVIPPADAAAFVAASIGSMPKAHEAVIVARTDRSALDGTLRWIDHDIDEGADGTCRITIRADSVDWLLSTIATLAMSGELTVEGPPEVAAAVAGLGQRLSGSAPGPR